MRASTLALLFGLLLVVSPFTQVRADESEEYDEDETPSPAAKDDEGDVAVLTEKNFDATITKHKFVLAEFYAPWCGHCKTLAPQYAKAATALKSHDADVVLAKIDATVESALGQKYGVQGYPTLKWFVDGEPVEYNGPRDADGIIGWIKKKTGPPAITVESADKLTDLEASAPSVVVGYFKELKGSAYEAFKAAASKVEDVSFVETTSKDVAKLANLAKPGVAFIKNFKGEERNVLAYTGDMEAEALTVFVNGEKIPLTIEFNQDNSEKIFNSGIKRQVLLWGSTAELESDSSVFQTFKKVASQFKGKLIFVLVNNEGSSHEPVTNFFGLKDASSPSVVGFYMEKNRKYKMPEALTEEALSAFCQAVVDGTAPVEYKSAPIPEDNKDEDVTVVVGKTVDSIVFDETKDVLIEIYAPWCGHCKQLEPTYKKLAKRFRKVDSVVIAKMDGTENEHPDLEVKGFPTIYFVPAGKDSKPIVYDATERGVKDFTKYIKQHAKVPYTLPKKGESPGEAKESKDEL